MFLFLVFVGTIFPFIEGDSSFVIERSKDANQIFYTIQIEKQVLSTENPMIIYWIKHTKNGIKEDLTWIQKKYAYGINYLKRTPQEAVFRFVSYDKMDFTIKKDGNGTYEVFTNMQKKEIIVKRIFIHLKGGSFWMPHIPQIDIEGISAETGKPFKQSIKP